MTVAHLYVFVQKIDSQEPQALKIPLDSKVSELFSTLELELNPVVENIKHNDLTVSLDSSKSFRELGYDAYNAIEIRLSANMQSLEIQRLNNTNPLLVEIADQTTYHLDAKQFKRISDVKKYITDCTSIATSVQIALHGSKRLSDGDRISELSPPKVIILQSNHIRRLCVNLDYKLCRDSALKQISLSAYLSDTVEDVKKDLLKQLKKNQAIPGDAVTDDYGLIHKNEELRNSQPIKDILTQENPTLFLRTKETIFFSVIGSRASPKTKFSLKITPSCKVKTLESIISEKIKMPVRCILYVGKQLSGDRTVADYSIGNESYIRVLTLRAEQPKPIPFFLKHYLSYQKYVQESWQLPTRDLSAGKLKKSKSMMEGSICVCINESSFGSSTESISKILLSNKIFMLVIELQQTFDNNAAIDSLIGAIKWNPQIANLDLRGDFFYKHHDFVISCSKISHLVSITCSQFASESVKTSFPAFQESPDKPIMSLEETSISENLLELPFSEGTTNEATDKLMKNRQNAKAFLEACEVDNVFLVAEQLEKGLSPNIYDNTGNTALHYAARGGALDTAELLLKSGANKWVTNKDQLLPEHLSIQALHPTTQAFIRDFE